MMTNKIRILPLTVAVMLLLFGIKLTDVWQGTRGIFLSFDAPVAVAAEKAKPEKEEADPPEVDETADTESTDTEHAPESDESQSSTTSMVGTLDFSDSEIEILEKLAGRRAALDKRNSELDLRDNLLQVTEARIDEKIIQLKKIEATIQDLLQKHDSQEAKQLASLVKIYEKMKPKHAARIFNGLEMDILLDVASMMKESKMAAVLAAMNSEKANELTVELATRRRLPGEKKNES